MQDTDFLSRVMPPEGDYYIAKYTDTGRFIEVQKGISSFTELQEATDTYAAQFGTFVAIGSFEANTSREAVHSNYKKAFYIDIDCGPEKPYKTKADGLKAFSEFVEASGILKPTKIIDSGNGWHMYWILDRAIPVTAWERIATLFKGVCIKLHLHADHAITADASRYLRYPGSLNNKDPKNKKEVRTLKSLDYDYTAKEFLNSIKHWVGKVEVQPLGSGDAWGADCLDGQDIPSALATEELPEDLFEGIEGYGPKRFEYGKTECLIMHDMLETGGENYGEGAWKAALNVLVWCEDGHDYLHAISDKHPDYDKRATEHKWRFSMKYKEDLEAGKRTRGGPTLCSSLAFHCGPELCSRCPHQGRVKTPVTLYTSPFGNEKMPPGFNQSEQGIFFKSPDPEENAIFIAGFNIINFKCNFDIDAHGATTTQLTFTVVKGGKEYPVMLDNANCIDYRKMYQSLCNQHVQIETSYNPRIHFGTLMNAWSQLLSNTNSTTKTQARFGWITHDGKHGFSVGDETIWSDDSTTQAVSVDPIMAKRYSGHGDLNKWRAAVQFALNQERQQINAVIASSFGAPLMKFTGERGVILALVSECSASGKTMALQLAGSVWGNPQDSFNSMDDTVNSINNKMGTLSNLPMYWDEVRNLKESVGFSKLLFSLCQGREKARMTATIKQQHTGSWATIMVATSNESLIGYVDAANPNESNAGRMRILEFEVDVITDDSGKEIFHNLDDNYGVAGRIYAEHLAKNHDAVRDRVREAQKKIRKALKCETAERFWVAAMATTIVGAELATELGLLKFNTTKLKHFFTGVIQENKRSIVQHAETGSYTSNSILGQFINERSSQGLRYEDMDKQGNPIGAALSTVESGGIEFEHGRDSNIFKINKPAFHKWLERQGREQQQTSLLRDLYNKSKYFKELRTQFGESHNGTAGIKVQAFMIKE